MKSIPRSLTYPITKTMESTWGGLFFLLFFLFGWGKQDHRKMCKSCTVWPCEHTFWNEQAFTNSDILSRNKACAFFNNSTGLAFLVAEQQYKCYGTTWNTQSTRHLQSERETHIDNHTGERERETLKLQTDKPCERHATSLSIQEWMHSIHKARNCQYISHSPPFLWKHAQNLYKCPSTKTNKTKLNHQRFQHHRYQTHEHYISNWTLKQKDLKSNKS